MSKGYHIGKNVGPGWYIERWDTYATEAEAHAEAERLDGLEAELSSKTLQLAKALEALRWADETMETAGCWTVSEHLEWKARPAVRAANEQPAQPGDNDNQTEER